jgi:hypothetical protein
MEQTHYVGSCPHDIPAEWYNSDESTYNVLDTVTGTYVIVTTCEECKRENEEAGRIIDDVDLPMDDFYVPEDFIPKSVVVVKEDGSTEVVEIEAGDFITDDEINEALDNDEYV